MQIVGGDVGVLDRDRLKDPVPQSARVDQHVVLVDQRELLAPRGGPYERIPYDPLHAHRRVDADLGGDLVRRALADDAAVAAVQPFGALAYDDEVDELAVDDARRQWRRDAGVELGRPQVHGVVEREAQLQQEPALEET